MKLAIGFIRKRSNPKKIKPGAGEYIKKGRGKGFGPDYFLGLAVSIPIMSVEPGSFFHCLRLPSDHTLCRDDRDD